MYIKQGFLAVITPPAHIGNYKIPFNEPVMEVKFGPVFAQTQSLSDAYMGLLQ